MSTTGIRVWEECVEQLRRELPDDEFNTWIRPLRRRRSSAGILHVLAPNRYVREAVLGSYFGRMQHLLQQGSEQPIAVLIDVPRRQYGVLCLETVWGLAGGLRENTSPYTRPLLELLGKVVGTPYVYRDVSTAAEADYCLGRWVGRGTSEADEALGNLGVLYLGFHGSAGALSFDDGNDIRLDGLAQRLQDGVYDCSGAVIHFAACSVLRAKRQVADFKDAVGAAVVSGYTRELDFVMSWAFEFMYLERLSRCNFGDLDTLERLQRDMADNPVYAPLAERFGFEIV